MNISFGAKLLTKPEQFFHKTDTPEQRKKATFFVKGLRLLVENPIFDSFTKNDTIELRRTPSKKGHFNYHISYKSPELKEVKAFENITMEIGNDMDVREVFGAFTQISYAPMYKKGVFDKKYSLFETYEDSFERAFNMSFQDYVNTIIESCKH